MDDYYINTTSRVSNTNVTIWARNTSRDLTIQHGYDTTFTTIMKVEMICLPVICILGLVGNTISTITFLRKPLRNTSCSFYLAVRGISDNGFLFSLLLIWTSSTFSLRLSQVKGVCQFIIFTTYLCGCVSVWLCVLITLGNFMLIYYPFIANGICSDRSSKICVLTLTVIAVGCYNTSLWITNGDCSHNASFTDLTQVLVYMDTLLTLVIPTIIITVLLCLILYKVIHVLHRRRVKYNMCLNTSNSLHKCKIAIPITQVTQMLCVVSLTFFILNVPSHVIRLRLMIGSFIKGHEHAPHIEATIQTVFQLIYYLSFSVNIIVYWAFGSNFRKTFKTLFPCIFRRSQCHQHLTREAVNLVRLRRHSINGEKHDHERCVLLTVDMSRETCQSQC